MTVIDNSLAQGKPEIHRLRTRAGRGLRLVECAAPVKIDPDEWPRYLTHEQNGVLIALVFAMWRDQYVFDAEFARTSLLRMRPQVAKRIGLAKLIKEAERLTRQRAPIDPDVRDEVARAADFKCHYCGCDLPAGHHTDHAIPVARGGRNVIENFRASCPSCNRRKRTMTEDEFITLLRGEGVES